MNAPSGESTGLNLPQPIKVETHHSQSTEAAPAASSPEQAPVQGQRDPTNVDAGSAAPVAAVLPLPPTPLAATPQTDDQSATAVSPSGATPAIADDGDLIEKEWVSKAKQIVEHTREDPYQQSKQLNLFKADYMKKRYNKTLKLSE